MKRIVIFILALMIAVCLVIGCPMMALATTDEAQLVDVDIYKAQCFAGIAADPNTNLVELCNNIHNYYVYGDVYSYTKTFLDGAYADEELMDNFDYWKRYSIGADPSQAFNAPVQKKDYYESLVMAIMVQSLQEDSKTTEYFENMVTGYAASITGELCNIAEVADSKELIAKYPDLADDGIINAFKGVFTKNPELGPFDVAEQILSFSDTVLDAIDRMAAYATMRSLDVYTKSWLEYMYNACGKDKPLLKEALFNLKNSSNSFTESVMIEIRDTSFRLTAWTVGTTVNAYYSTIASTNPVTATLLAGLKLGKTISDMCFGTSDIYEQFFLLECIYDVQELARTVVVDTYITFFNDQTRENAKTYTYAVDFYFESLTNTDIDCMIDFLDNLYHGGIDVFKDVIRCIYGVTTDYQEVVNSLENIRESRQYNYDLMQSYYEYALMINYPEVYEHYFVEKDVIPVTDIYYSYLKPLHPAVQKGEADLLVGDFVGTYVHYTPSNTTQKAYYFTSDNSEVLQVKDGIISAVSPGTANVTVVSVENPEVSYTTQIVVGTAEEAEDGAENEQLEEIRTVFTYTVSEGNATITGLVNGYEPTRLTIPSKISGYPVVSIGDDAFCGCDSLKSITIGDNVTCIGDDAFRSCGGLTSIAIGNSVTSIGNWAFWRCSSLTSVTIPDSVTSMGDHTFRECDSLTSVTIGDNVTSIGDGAFRGCRGLTSVTIGNSVTSIGDDAFCSCGSLKSVTIPDGVTSIGDGAFSWCRSLTSVAIPDSVTSIGSLAFYECNNLNAVHITDLTAWCNINYHGFPSNPLSNANNLYLNGELVTNLVIPDSVTSIGEGAFYGCSSLISAIIPDSVTSIGNHAFYKCDSLTSITIPDSVTSIDDSAFYGCSSLNVVHISDVAAWCSIVFYEYDSNPLNEAKNLYLNGDLVTNLVIPDSVSAIPDYAFGDCSSLTSVTIGDSVTSIGVSAFSHCSSLTSVTIGDSVTSIGDHAFYECDSLTGVTIPDSVTAIPDSAFRDCSSLTSVTIGDSVTSIGDWAFYGCNNITSVTIPNSVTSIGDRAFNDCYRLTSVTIGDSVTSIGDWAFDMCGLTSVTIPNSVISIGNDVFSWCSNLTSITVDSNNPNYSSDANGVLFNKDKSLLIQAPGAISGAYIIPDSVTTIGNWAFENCDNLTNVTIPDGVTSIGDEAFSWCRSLISVTIPNSVISIGDGAFEVSNNLDHITFSGSEIQWSAVDIGDDNSALTDAEYFHFNTTLQTTHTCLRLTIYCPACQCDIYTKKYENSKHTEAVLLAREPTCTATGLTEGSHCSVCGEVLVAQEEIPALDHSYNAAVTVPNCENGGYTTYTCTACSDSYIGERIEALGHAVKNGICTICGKKFVTVTTQPVTRKVVAGNTAKFTVKATGNELKYQWQYRTSSSGSWKNVSAASGKTASYSLTAQTRHSSYQYRCKVTDATGNYIYTKMVYLYVLGIKTQPTTQKVKAGQTAKFTVSATGANKTYQWQYKTSSTGSWKNISADNSKTANYSLTAENRHNGYYYRCRVTDSAGNRVYTKTVRLFVLAIKSQPTTQKVKAGATAKFTVSAIGNGLKYQWQYKTSSTGSWKNISAANSKTANYSLTAENRHNGYYYRCRVTDSAGNTVYTKTVRLFVLGIKTQPVSRTVEVGKTAKFTVSAIGNGLKFQWQYRTSATGSWKNISADSAKTASYSLTALNRHNGYQYRCKITDSAGNVIYTNIVKLTVKK